MHVVDAGCIHLNICFDLPTATEIAEYDCRTDTATFAVSLGESRDRPTRSRADGPLNKRITTTHSCTVRRSANSTGNRKGRVQKE
jgi:hypothetical protein